MIAKKANGKIYISNVAIKSKVNHMESTEIEQKLDILIKLVAMGAVGNQPLREQIRRLDMIGLAPKDIAAILGKSPNHVRVELTYIRKQKKTGGEQNGE